MCFGWIDVEQSEHPTIFVEKLGFLFESYPTDNQWPIDQPVETWVWGHTWNTQVESIVGYPKNKG